MEPVGEVSMIFSAGYAKNNPLLRMTCNTAKRASISCVLHAHHIFLYPGFRFRLRYRYKIGLHVCALSIYHCLHTWR